MSLLPSDFDRLADDRFAEYCRAAEQAQATRNIADAKRAGQAWADFIDVFPEARRPPTTWQRPTLVRSQ